MCLLILLCLPFQLAIVLLFVISNTATTAFIIPSTQSSSFFSSDVLGSLRQGKSLLRMSPLSSTKIPNEDLNMDISKAKMIVFDKDGTLGDDVATTRRWALHMTECLERVSGATDAQVQEFHTALGWDSTRQAMMPSAPLAAGTWEGAVDSLRNILKKYNLPGNADEWHGMIELHGADDPLIPNLRDMLQDCMDRGLMVAICTSDERSSTDKALAFWNIQDLISYSICGDEVGDSPKPSAIPLELLCQQVSKSSAISPQECIVVGDTTSDTGMAQNANALFCIGVLTGSGTRKILTETGADVVLPSVADIPNLLTTMGRSTVVE